VSSESDTNRCATKGRGIVGSVAQHHHTSAFAFKGINHDQLVRWQQVGPHVLDSQLAAHPVGMGYVVAGEQHRAVDTEGRQPVIASSLLTLATK